MDNEAKVRVSVLCCVSFMLRLRTFGSLGLSFSAVVAVICRGIPIVSPAFGFLLVLLSGPWLLFSMMLVTFVPLYIWRIVLCFLLLVIFSSLIICMCDSAANRSYCQALPPIP